MTRYAIPAHANPLVRRLFETMNERDISLDEVAHRAGVDRATIYQWRRHDPKLGNIVAALNAVGLNIKLEAAQ